MVVADSNQVAHGKPEYCNDQELAPFLDRSSHHNSGLDCDPADSQDSPDQPSGARPDGGSTDRLG